MPPPPSLTTRRAEPHRLPVGDSLATSPPPTERKEAWPHGGSCAQIRKSSSPRDVGGWVRVASARATLCPVAEAVARHAAQRGAAAPVWEGGKRRHGGCRRRGTPLGRAVGRRLPPPARPTLCHSPWWLARRPAAEDQRRRQRMGGEGGRGGRGGSVWAVPVNGAGGLGYIFHPRGPRRSSHGSLDAARAARTCPEWSKATRRARVGRGVGRRGPGGMGLAAYPPYCRTAREAPRWQHRSVVAPATNDGRGQFRAVSQGVRKSGGFRTSGGYVWTNSSTFW